MCLGYSLEEGHALGSAGALKDREAFSVSARQGTFLTFSIPHWKANQKEDRETRRTSVVQEL